MNERYLVRGKRKDNGEWVVGYYTVDAAGQEIIDVMNDMRLFESCHPIDPSTLGAYTGIADKNGKRIFDGDIVRHYNDFRDPEKFDVGDIYWDGFGCKWRRTSNEFFPDDVEISGNNEFIYEVIGNIYDNPDLLEEAE